MYDVRRLLADFCALRAIPRSIYREILKYDVITVRRVFMFKFIFRLSVTSVSTFRPTCVVSVIDFITVDEREYEINASEG